MRDEYWSIFARKTFNLNDPSRITELILHIEFDDGYIAYINGVEVHSEKLSSPAAYDDAASDHEAVCESVPHYDISEFISALAPGTNVLALQVHNQRLNSSDFIFIPALSAVADPPAGDVEPDGDIDLNDLASMALSWQADSIDANYNPYCDIDSDGGDGKVDVFDLLVLADNWLSEF